MCYLYFNILFHVLIVEMKRSNYANCKKRYSNQNFQYNQMFNFIVNISKNT